MDLQKTSIQMSDTVKRTSSSLNCKEVLKKKVPIIQWLPSYTLTLFFQDLLAGFTVSLTEIPQAIANAVIAGLPPQYGLYSACTGCFVYLVLGSCNVINMGPTPIIALVCKNAVASLGPPGVGLICFLSGLLVFAAGILNLGFIIDFFSYPIIAAFTTAAAIEIAATQIKNILGIGGDNNSFVESWEVVLKYGSEYNKWDVILGICTMTFLFVVKEVDKRYSTSSYRKDWSRRRNYIGRILYMFSLTKNAVVVMVTSTAAYIFHSRGCHPFSLTGDVQQGLPEFKLPSFNIEYNGTYHGFDENIGQYGSTIVSISVITIVEQIAIAKAFTKGRALDATQEFTALGVSNVVVSLVQSIPITGSFSRTAINHSSGAKTTVSGVVTGVLVLFSLAFLTSSFAYIPKATLAAVIIVAMFYLCEFDAVGVLWRTKKLDLIPFTITLTCCLFLSMEYGIFMGIATNLIFVLYATARPKLQIEEINTSHGNGFLVASKTGLHYAAAEYVREKILETCCGENTLVIINGECVGNIDTTVAKCFHSLKEELEARGQRLVFFNFKKSVRESIVGIDMSLTEAFRGGSLQDIFEGSITKV